MSRGGAQPPDLVIRGYRPGDEAGIIELFQRCFGTSMSPALWRWKYAKNPLGNGFIQVAERKGRIVAHYGAYPVAITRNGKVVGTALHIGDVMTDPRVRSLGFGRSSVIARVAHAFYESYCRNRVLFNYGAPSFKHLRLGQLFFDYQTIGPIQEWVLPQPGGVRRVQVGLRTRTLLERFRWIAGRAIDARAVHDLFKTTGKHLGMAVERDPAYLRWRYLEHPRFYYRQYAIYRDDRLLLWAVARDQDDQLWIGDLLLDPHFPQALPFWIGQLQAASPGKILRIWSPGRPGWWAALLMDLGFRPRSHPLQVRTAFTLFDSNAVSILRLNKDWYYAMGDFDLF